MNYPGFSQQSSNVLNFTGAFTDSGGTPVYITNNTFDFNQDAPMAISPDGLLAGDPQRPLQSGHPFFRGNVLVNNDINGLAVLALPSYPARRSGGAGLRPQQHGLHPRRQLRVGHHRPRLCRPGFDHSGRDVATSFTRCRGRPLPSATSFGQALTPAVNLTIESALPDTLLANGQTIAQPGESAIVKFSTIRSMPA